jgi:hypothetical protein
MKWLMTFFAIGVGVTAAVLLAIWAITGFAALGLHGAILGALILGVLLSGGLAIGLMGLVFASGRDRYDEAAYRYELVKDNNEE